MTRKELTATLSVCPNSWNYSDPLVLRTLNFLKSFMGQRPTWPDFAFADLVFHELLHTWLVENFIFNGPLLSKYKSEPPIVRAHLHLMAIQKFVYLELGRKDLSSWISWKYSGMSKDYARAWQIVDQIEGYAPFIQELKEATTARR